MKRNSDFAMIKSGFFNGIFWGGRIGENMSEKSKVLVVDDKQVERVMMKRILSGTYEVIEAENGKEAFEILYERSTEITAVLLDIVMPEYDGYYFLERYHKAQMYQAIPVIVLTMEIDIETEIKCLGMGAWDFIRKPYDVDVVRFRLKNVIGSSSQNISKALKYRAEYDILTGIYNKTNMFQATSAMLERYPDRHFAFVRMDIEKFQLINSFFGMSAGDMLLKYIADLLICAVRNRSDVTFGRMDADIFCFCVSYENTKELVESFDKMRDILSRYPLDFDIVPIFGVYLIAGKKITPDHMYDRANLAAKHCKGNYIRNYAFYTRQMSQEIEKEQRIVNSNLVDSYRIPRRLFQVELTESAYNTNPKAVQDMMQRLREEGFYILMDDFGSGYSSLNVLKDIVVDVLKMDMKFFAGDDREGRGENIMAAVIRMAKWLNMPVVAEGVERIEQVEFLRSIGCEYVQGYYFAKPMPVEEYEKLQFDRPHAERKKETERLVDIDSLWTPASQLESLFLNAKQGVAVYEYGKEQIEIICVNNAYYEVFGYQNISQKKDIFQGIPKRYHKRILDAFFYTADKGRETQCEFSRKNEAGEEIFISLKLYDVGIVGNKHIIYGVFLNVTEPKQLEWELEKYRLLLSGKTKDREMEQEKEQSEE